MSEYVTFEDGVYRVAGSRVTLDMVVGRFHEGLAPQSICECFSSLSLEKVHGSIAFYLKNERRIDEYIAQGEAAAELLHAESRRLNADLHRSLRERHGVKVSR